MLLATVKLGIITFIPRSKKLFIYNSNSYVYIKVSEGYYGSNPDSSRCRYFRTEIISVIDATEE